jgi:RimJ/RimL family protein N-acetyltransferase
VTEAPIIHTERLTLRPHQMRDWEAMAAFFESDASCFVGGPLPRRRSWFGFGADVGSWALLGFGAWALEETASGDFVGQVALGKPPHFPEAEIGWITFPAYQRRGFAREAALAARAHAYGVLGWPTAVSYVDAENHASAGLARGIGCVEDPDAARFDAKDIVFRHPAPEGRA